MKGNLLSNVIAYRCSNMVCNPASIFERRKAWQRFFDVNRFNLWFPRHRLDMKTLFSLFADLLRDTVNDGTKIDVFFFTSINCRSTSRLPFHQTSSQATHDSGERGAASCVHPQQLPRSCRLVQGKN